MVGELLVGAAAVVREVVDGDEGAVGEGAELAEAVADADGGVGAEVASMTAMSRRGSASARQDSSHHQPESLPMRAVTPSGAWMM